MIYEGAWMWKFATLDSQVWLEAVLTQFVSSRLMASLTRCTWVWVNSGSWWWTGRPGVLRFMGLQRVEHDWATELNWTETVSGHVTLCTSIFLLLVSEAAVASFSKFPTNAAILWFRCSWKVECIFFFSVSGNLFSNEPGNLFCNYSLPRVYNLSAVCCGF